MPKPDPHEEALEVLALAPAVRARLAAYLGRLDHWASRVNLTGAQTPAMRVSVLVAPAVRALPAVSGVHVLDVGSGNGSPGLVLALLRPELRVTLLEPRARRWAFLREAARGLAPGVTALRARHDTYTGPRGDTVTMRALAVSPESLRPLVAPAGRLLLFGWPGPAPAAWTPLASPDENLLVLSP